MWQACVLCNHSLMDLGLHSGLFTSHLKLACLDDFQLSNLIFLHSTTGLSPSHTLESMWQDMKTALSLLKSSSQWCIKTWLGYTFFHTLSLTSSLDLLSSGLGGGFCCPSLLTWWPPPTQGLLVKAGGAEPFTSSAVTGSPFKDHEDTPSYHYYRVAMGWAALEVFWHSHKHARSY